MENRFKIPALILVLFMGLFFQGATVSCAEEKPDITGWEKDSPYNQHYNLSEYDKFKGTVEDIKECVPLPGMAPGILVVVRDADEELVNVHLGPKSFVDVNTIGLKKGDEVKVKGVWAEIGEQDVFMASKIKKGEYVELKVRLTKDGTPFWTMTPEQLAQEKEDE